MIISLPDLARQIERETNILVKQQVSLQTVKTTALYVGIGQRNPNARIGDDGSFTMQSLSATITTEFLNDATYIYNAIQKLKEDTSGKEV